MVTRDESWELTDAITGGKRPNENLFLEDIVGLTKDLREDREHLLAQLAAASEFLVVVRAKRRMSSRDFEELIRILSVHIPTWLDEQEAAENNDGNGNPDAIPPPDGGGEGGHP